MENLQEENSYIKKENPIIKNWPRYGFTDLIKF